MLKHPKELVAYSVLLTIITVVASLIVYPLRDFITGTGYAYVLMPILFIVCMSAMYALIYFVTKRFWPEVFENNPQASRLGDIQLRAILGSLLIPYNEAWIWPGRSAIPSACPWASSSRVVLIGAGMERIALCRVPKAFRGLPVLLIYLGLLSLAFYGLIGHQLPT
jgi:electron transport complex protein RnfA